MADGNDVQNLVDKILIAIAGGESLTGIGHAAKRWHYDYGRHHGYIQLNDGVWSLTKLGQDRVKTLMARPKA